MGNIKAQVHTCYHCGNTGLLKYIGQTNWKNEHIDLDSFGNATSYTLIEHEDWLVFECPVCNKPVLVKQYVFDIMNDRPEITTVYPTITTNSDGVPKEIYTAFESAIKTKWIDYPICLLSLRRVLEMICKDKGAVGGNLEKKIENLINRGVFPPMIEDACWIIRQLGNEAAHADKIKVFRSDIEQVIEYVATIIDYLYSLPYRVDKMKKKIEARKNK